MLIRGGDVKRGNLYVEQDQTSRFLGGLPKFLVT